MYKIFIVEDDSTIAKILSDTLNKWGYDTKCVDDFNNIVNEFKEYDPQLVILDISLPFFNGFHWCSEIRKISKVPIIFESSANDNMNLIMSINMGGDDFISKPFDLNVIVAKVQAIIRRTYDFKLQVNNINCSGVVLNVDEAILTYKDNKLELSKNEFKIMQILIQNKNKVVSRDEIMKYLWDSESFIDDNTLTVNITRLRKKLEEYLYIKDFIKTKKGLGYIINEQ